MNIRTNILIISTLMSILACSEKAVTPDSQEALLPINIGTVSTRALITGIDQIDEFGVSCAISNIEQGSNYGSIMHNERVYPTNDAHTAWDYDNTRYWLADRNFYFVASYPYSQDGTGVGSFQQMEEELEGVKYVGYSLSVDTYDDANKSHAGVDILTAATHVNTSEEIPETVSLNFRHLLTNVNLKISQDLSQDGDPNNDYYITKVSLQGLYTNGKYLAMPNGNEILNNWSLENVTGQSIEKTFDGLESLRSKGEVSVWGDEGGLLLIPQEIQMNKVKIRIDYFYQLAQADEQNGQSGTNESNRKERYIETYIPASTDLWQSNKRITYTLSIANPTKINFLTPSIESWGTPQTGGTIIIK